MKQLTVLAFFVIAIIPFTFGCSNPADEVPAAQVSPAGESLTAASESPDNASSRVYEIMEESSIGFVGSKITGSHDGGFKGFEGKVILVDGDPTLSKVEVEIDTTTLWADNEKLEGHLKSPDFFDVETFPTATFISSVIRRVDDSYTVIGNLELRGVTKEISFPAQIEMQAGQITANAEFSLMRFDFGIVYPGRSDDLIRDAVVVKLAIVAKPVDSQD